MGISHRAGEDDQVSMVRQGRSGRWVRSVRSPGKFQCGRLGGSRVVGTYNGRRDLYPDSVDTSHHSVYSKSMTTTQALTDNLTASGPSLREAILEWTGCDPLTEASFAWSNTDECDGCGVHDSTAVLSFDGDTFERMCFHCAIDAW